MCKVKKKKSFAERYWTQVVKDYLSCYGEVVSNKKIDEVVNRLLEDDEMWSAIDTAVNYHLGKVK